MLQVITAPSNEEPKYMTLFLAGGITNCKDWQNEVVNNINSCDITVFNPRQINFDITDHDATRKQIEWEFKRLEQMDIFTMYFCNSDSDQPICMYELGRNIVKMQNRFPNDWENRIVVSVEEGYKRADDVRIQMQLCAPKIFVDCDSSPTQHAYYIRNVVNKLFF